MKSYLGIGINQAILDIDKILEKDKEVFVRALPRIVSILSSYEVNLSIPLMTLAE